MQFTLDDIDLSSLTKANLGALLFDQLGLNKREAGDLVDAFFGIITERLVAGEEVKLSDFAAFQVRTKAPRPGRNPKTGEVVEIAGRRVVTFQAGTKLKARLKEGIQSENPSPSAQRAVRPPADKLRPKVEVGVTAIAQ